MREDPKLRTLAQKEFATNREDLQLRVLGEKYPTIKIATKEVSRGQKDEPIQEEGTNALIKSEDDLYIRQEEIF